MAAKPTVNSDSIEDEIHASGHLQGRASSFKRVRLVQSDSERKFERFM